MSGIELKGLKGLKGLENLLQENKEGKTIDDSASVLPIDQLSPSIFQPRSIFEDESLQNLASSIKENGIIQPLIVRRMNFEKYEIIAGERRWRAAQLVGLNEVPVVIRKITDEVAIVFALVENIQREKLNPIEQASSLFRLVNEYSMTHEYISKIVGLSRSTVTNLIRLLSLPIDIQKLIIEGKMEAGHAKAMLSLEGEEQTVVSRTIIDNNLSVRDTEKFIQKIKSSLTSKNTKSYRYEAIELGKKFTETLQREVHVLLNKSGKGKVEIKFNTIEEVQWLINHLKIE